MTQGGKIRFERAEVVTKLQRRAGSKESSSGSGFDSSEQGGQGERMWSWRALEGTSRGEASGRWTARQRGQGARVPERVTEWPEAELT